MHHGVIKLPDRCVGGCDPEEKGGCSSPTEWLSANIIPETKTQHGCRRDLRRAPYNSRKRISAIQVALRSTY